MPVLAPRGARTWSHSGLPFCTAVGSPGRGPFAPRSVSFALENALRAVSAIPHGFTVKGLHPRHFSHAASRVLNPKPMRVEFFDEAKRVQKSSMPIFAPSVLGIQFDPSGQRE